MSTLNKVKKLKAHEVFSFWEPDFEGSCPCFGGSVKDKLGEVHVRGRCWRVSEGESQDLYVWGEHPDLDAIASETKRALDETNWHNDYVIKREEF